jgi:hypothetical protein
MQRVATGVRAPPNVLEDAQIGVVEIVLLPNIQKLHSPPPPLLVARAQVARNSHAQPLVGHIKMAPASGAKMTVSLYLCASQRPAGIVARLTAHNNTHAGSTFNLCRACPAQHTTPHSRSPHLHCRMLRCCLHCQVLGAVAFLVLVIDTADARKRTVSSRQSSFI